MQYRNIMTLTQLGCAGYISWLAISSADPLKQALAFGSWFMAGFVIARVWSAPHSRSRS